MRQVSLLWLVTCFNDPLRDNNSFYKNTWDVTFHFLLLHRYNSLPADWGTTWRRSATVGISHRNSTIYRKIRGNVFFFFFFLCYYYFQSFILLKLFVRCIVTFLHSLVVFALLGATLPARSTGSEKTPSTGRGDQPPERCSGHTLLHTTGSSSGSGVPSEAQPWFPVGDCKGISCSVSC